MSPRPTPPHLSRFPHPGRVRQCTTADFAAVHAIINAAAARYEGHIPPDRWHEPYMPRAELRAEIAAGVAFWGLERAGRLVGVMGLQPVRDVTLVRHAYVAPACQRQGVGSRLLTCLRALTTTPVLVGTWAAATWAVAFYEKHGFARVPAAEKTRLLHAYWAIPERQVETSVVLADAAWLQREGRGPGRGTRSP